MHGGRLWPLWQTRDGFLAYGAHVPEQFEPVLNEEHSAAGWFPFDQLPTPLHPSIPEGVRNTPFIEGKSDKARSEN